MKKLIAAGVFVSAVLLLVTGSLTAQDEPTRIVFVDGPRLITAHPAGQAANELQQQAQEEIRGLEEDIRATIGGAQSMQELTAEQRDRLDALQRTMQAAQERWQRDIQDAVQPALEAVNTAVREVAQENGYTLVLDGAVAGESGMALVVYAKDGLDITEQVIERLR